MTQKKILVVDDEQDLCEILLYNLKAAGYEAEAAYSGEMAMDKNPSQYDLLLLDVMMPGISGFELAERLKGDENTSRIPIIFLTAKDTEDDTLKGFGLGADDYAPQPPPTRIACCFRWPTSGSCRRTTPLPFPFSVFRERQVRIDRSCPR